MFSGITNDDASPSGSPPRDSGEGEEEQRHNTEAKPEDRGLKKKVKTDMVIGQAAPLLV